MFSVPSEVPISNHEPSSCLLRANWQSCYEMVQSGHSCLSLLDTSTTGPLFILSSFIHDHAALRYLLQVAIAHPIKRLIAPEPIVFISLMVIVACPHMGTTFCPPPIQSRYPRLANAIDHNPQPSCSHHVVVWRVFDIQGCTKHPQM